MLDVTAGAPCQFRPDLQGCLFLSELCASSVVSDHLSCCCKVTVDQRIIGITLDKNLQRVCFMKEPGSLYRFAKRFMADAGFDKLVSSVDCKTMARCKCLVAEKCLPSRIALRAVVFMVIVLSMAITTIRRSALAHKDSFVVKNEAVIMKLSVMCPASSGPPHITSLGQPDILSSLAENTLGFSGTSSASTMSSTLAIPGSALHSIGKEMNTPLVDVLFLL